MSDAAKYIARQIRETGKINDCKKIVYEILKSNGGEMKREEIIREFERKVKCEDLELDNEVTSALKNLLQYGKIERTRHGYYQAI